MFLLHTWQIKNPYSLIGSEIYVRIGVYPGSKKKISTGKCLGKYYYILGRIQAKWDAVVRYILSIAVGSGGSSAAPGKFYNFIIYSSLETVFPPPKLTELLH